MQSVGGRGPDASVHSIGPTWPRPPCPQCGYESSLALWGQDRNRWTTKERFAYYRCGSCRLLFLWPIPEQLEAFYPEDYYAIPRSIDDVGMEAQAQRPNLELILRFVRTGRLLEIGPAYGAFAHAAKLAGFEVDTIEMDGRCCRFLEEQVGVRAYHSSDPAIVVQDLATYDVVAMWQVIEHLADPWSLLDILPKHVSSGGILVIAAPNPEAWQFLLFGGRWTHVDAPRHLQLIPIRVLVERLERQGLMLRHRTMSDPVSIGWGRFGWQWSLANMAKSKSARSLFRILGAVLGRTLGPLEAAAGRGAAYTLVLRR